MFNYWLLLLLRLHCGLLERFNRFFHGMLERGVYLAQALYEAGFVSAAHTDADISTTLAAAREALR